VCFGIKKLPTFEAKFLKKLLLIFLVLFLLIKHLRKSDLFIPLPVSFEFLKRFIFVPPIFTMFDEDLSTGVKVELNGKIPVRFLQEN
jgi:hypothetical protein